MSAEPQREVFSILTGKPVAVTEEQHLALRQSVQRGVIESEPPAAEEFDEIKKELAYLRQRAEQAPLPPPLPVTPAPHFTAERDAALEGLRAQLLEETERRGRDAGLLLALRDQAYQLRAALDAEAAARATAERALDAEKQAKARGRTPLGRAEERAVAAASEL